jgi:hypothetical protein
VGQGQHGACHVTLPRSTCRATIEGRALGSSPRVTFGQAAPCP